MKLTERLRQLYFAKYDDQMNGLDEDEEKEFKLLNKQILKFQAIVYDIATCTKSDIQRGKKTITLARLQTLLRGMDYEIK